MIGPLPVYRVGGVILNEKIKNVQKQGIDI